MASGKWVVVAAAVEVGLVIGVAVIHAIMSHLRAISYFGGLPQGRILIRHRLRDGKLAELVQFQPATDCLTGPAIDALFAADQDQWFLHVANHEQRMDGNRREATPSERRSSLLVSNAAPLVGSLARASE